MNERRAAIMANKVYREVLCTPMRMNPLEANKRLGKLEPYMSGAQLRKYEDFLNCIEDLRRSWRSQQKEKRQRMKPSMNDRFIQQARKDYAGTPRRIARCIDRYGEEHVIIELDLGGGGLFWLDWIGAEFATEPDEFDELPFSGLKWRPIELPLKERT